METVLILLLADHMIANYNDVVYYADVSYNRFAAAELSIVHSSLSRLEDGAALAQEMKRGRVEATQMKIDDLTITNDDNGFDILSQMRIETDLCVDQN